MFARRFTKLVAVCVLGVSGSQAVAAEYTWTNAAGGNWNLAANWNPGGVPPVAADNATLGELAGNYTVTLTDPRSITDLTLASSQATLTQTGNLTASGTIAVNSGTYNLNGGTLALNGTMTTGAGANVIWAGSTLTGNGTLAGTITVTGGGSVTGTTLRNTGTIRWQNGVVLALGTGTTLTNALAGVIDFQADGSAFAVSFGSGNLINQGTLRKSGGINTNTTVSWGATLAGGGTLDAQVGTLNLSGGGVLGGGTTTVSGGGVVALTGGTFTVLNNTTFTAASSGGSTLKWAGANLTAESLGGTLAGTITVTGGGGVSGTTLRNAGTIQWQNGVVLANGSGTTLTNAPAGVIDFQADGSAFAVNFGSGNLINQGTLRKSGGINTNTTVSWGTQNAGLIDAQVGTLAFTSGMLANTGTVNAGNAATISAAITSGENGLVRGAAQGTGNYSGNQIFSSGSTLAPGGVGTAGRLIINGNVTLNNESAFNVDINGTAVRTGHDRLEVNGVVNINNASLTGRVSGFTPTAGQSYFILLNDNADAINGTFAGLAQAGMGTLDNAWNFQISYQGNFDSGSLTGGNDIVLYNFSPVPEPASILAVAAGGLGLAGWVRRRRRVIPAVATM